MKAKEVCIYALLLTWPLLVTIVLPWLIIVLQDRNFNTLIPLRQVQNSLCTWTKCCDTFLRTFTNMNEMKYSLHDNLHGQSMAIDSITRKIENNYDSLRLGLPIILEFYGPPGTGKSYACSLIAVSLFPREIRTAVVHTFDGLEMRYPANATFYSDHLAHWILGNLTICNKAFFIFKHSEHIPEEIMEEIYYGIMAKKGGIFIFTTNENAQIVSRIYTHLKKTGLKKEYMNHENFRPAMRRALFNMAVRIIFLPMEEQDLKYCMLDEFERLQVYIPSTCMVEKVYRNFHLDKYGTTEITCKDIKGITENIATYEKC